jgi:hypothetical protein
MVRANSSVYFDVNKSKALKIDLKRAFDRVPQKLLDPYSKRL